MTAFFDTCTVISLTSPSEPFHAWSLAKLAEFQAQGPVVINDVVYAECAPAVTSKDDLDAIISKFGFERAPSDDRALYGAGKRYQKHRDNGGSRSTVLPDFFIGSAAQTLGIPLVTANPKDFRHFFSGLRIVHPNGEEIVP